MKRTVELQPLPMRHRRRMFFMLLVLFIVVLPILFLYATGYRFNFLSEEAVFMSTGGMYIAAERTGVEIYIDNELVRETRTFRRAFYAQGLLPGVHRVHVQKPEHHTWVKELPVYPHLVTEAEAFTMPLVPQVRIISPWKNARGETVLTASSTLQASTTNNVVVVPRIGSSFVRDTEYSRLLELFSATSTEEEGGIARVADELEALFVDAATSSRETLGTTTKETDGVRLFEENGDVFAAWVDSRERMPYYYCAEEFDSLPNVAGEAPQEERIDTETELIGPVQYIPEDVVCDPVIMIDRKGEEVRSFDFYPGSIDLVVLARESGVYVTEVDNRAWQNVQPLLEGENLDVRTQNANIYVYDGELIYEVLTTN